MFARQLPLKLKPKARQDFKDILKYTQQIWGSDQRVKYKNLIQEAFDRIAANPCIGKRRDEINSSYFSYHLGSKGRHYIFYQVFEDRIEVVRILHDSMDFEQHFQQYDA